MCPGYCFVSGQDGPDHVDSIFLSRQSKQSSPKGTGQGWVPIPSEVYEHVKKEMWYLSLDELKDELGVSKRVARALRDGKQMTISENYLSILRWFVKLDRRCGRRARIRWAIEESRDRKRYIELNRYLAKMIAELPPDVAKMTGGGWITKRANFWQASSEWRDQIFALQILTGLKKWFTMVHECYPHKTSFLHYQSHRQPPIPLSRLQRSEYGHSLQFIQVSTGTNTPVFTAASIRLAR